jgi:hypothetical protein
MLIETNEHAPILLFVYRRYDLVKKTLDSISIDPLAKNSDLIIFSDGGKTKNDYEDVNNVRKYLHKQFDRKLFSSVSLYESHKNKGLAKSIIEGVSEVLTKHDRVIVVEDDVITSRDFLSYMNKMLSFYCTNNKVLSIGAYTVPIVIPKNYMEDVFASVRCSSCCWGTWRDKWKEIDWTISDYNRFRFNFYKRFLFNKFGDDLSSMLDDQMNNKIDSWAIRFDYHMWKNGMLNILPVKTRAENHGGNDRKGTHNKMSNTEIDRFKVLIEDTARPIMPSNITINNEIVKEYRRLYHVSIVLRMRRYVKNLLIYAFKMITLSSYKSW